MLIPPKKLSKIFNVHPNRILHVGAHRAEEASDYEDAGWGKLGICWIEVQPDLVQELKIKLNPQKNRIIEAAVWGESGIEMEFNRMTNSQSSSLFELGKHSDYYPKIQLAEKVQVTTKRIDNILDIDEQFELVNLDLQGAELEALKGMGTILNTVKWVYSEVNWYELYKGCALIKDLDAFLKEEGFVRMATYRESFVGWGDALYIRKELVRELNQTKIIRWKIFSVIVKQCYRLRFLTVRLLRKVLPKK